MVGVVPVQVVVVTDKKNSRNEAVAEVGVVDDPVAVLGRLLLEEQHVGVVDLSGCWLLTRGRFRLLVVVSGLKQCGWRSIFQSVDSY